MYLGVNDDVVVVDTPSEFAPCVKRFEARRIIDVTEFDDCFCLLRGVVGTDEIFFFKFDIKILFN